MCPRRSKQDLSAHQRSGRPDAASSATPSTSMIGLQRESRSQGDERPAHRRFQPRRRCVPVPSTDRDGFESTRYRGIRARLQMVWKYT